MDKNLDQTMQFSLERPNEDKLQEILKKVCQALDEKGYDPANQIIGYLISGDPTYITSYKEARKTIKQIDRNDMLEEILNFYLDKNNIK